MSEADIAACETLSLPVVAVERAPVDLSSTAVAQDGQGRPYLVGRLAETPEASLAEMRHACKEFHDILHVWPEQILLNHMAVLAFMAEGVHGLAIEDVIIPFAVETDLEPALFVVRGKRIEEK